MSNEQEQQAPNIKGAEEDITIVGSGLEKPQVNLGYEKQTNMGLGVFGEAPDFSEAQAKAQDLENQSIVSSMRKNPTITICGFKCNDVSMESLALLQETGSPFVKFEPLLSQKERQQLKSLAERRVGQKFEGGEDSESGKAVELEPLSEEESELLDKLLEKAKEENGQFNNPQLAILSFLALHDPSLSSDDLDTMVFEEPKQLRRHALKIGSSLPPIDLEEAGLQIGMAIKSAKDAKVIPVSNGSGGSPSMGKA